MDRVTSGDIFWHLCEFSKILGSPSADKHDGFPVVLVCLA